MKPLNFPSAPLAIAILHLLTSSATADTFYVSSYNDSTIRKVTSAGEVTTFATVPQKPYGMVFNSNGDLWVAISQFTNMIWRITPAGVGAKFSVAPSYFDATEIAFGPNGQLYLASQGGYGIQRRATTGTYLSYATGFTFPFGMAFDQQGSLFVSDLNNGRITKIAPDKTTSIFAANVFNCRGLAFDRENFLYVATGGSILKFTPAGERSVFASGFSSAGGMAFDSAGDLYVADFSGNSLKRVTPDGVVHPFASGFQGPQFVAVQPDLAAPSLALAAPGEIEISGGINFYYVTLFSDDLTTWLPLATNRINAASTVRLTDSTNSPTRFYKSLRRP